MADKNNTSSLLEAIKTKLSKFDNKPKPEKKKTQVNYFSQDLSDSEMDKTSIDKTNIGLIFEAEKKLENIRKKKLYQNSNKQKDIDLDLDDESLNVKDLGQKISIESKIKEIADELNLEEFEDDFEDEGTPEIDEKNVEEVNKDIDPIDLELMELEKEIAKNSQQKTQNIAEDQIAEDLNLKTYLDSKFEDEFEKIEEEIKQEKNIQEDASNQDKSDSINILNSTQINQNESNFNFANFNQTQNQVLFKITPAQDFLNKKSGENAEDAIEETSPIIDSVYEKVEEKVEEIIEEKVEEVPEIKPSLDNNVEENKNILEEKVEEVVENVIKEKIAENPSIQASINEKKEEKIADNNFSKTQSPNIENYQGYEEEKQSPNNQNFNDKEVLKTNEEIVEKNNLTLEKINYNLIHEETIYQATNSMKKLMEAKNLVNNIGNFARDETLTKIAVNLMEPKLEKWLNENLPLMVENIVRKEIEKIVPKDSSQS